MAKKRQKTKTKQQEDSSQIAYQESGTCFNKELVPGQRIAYRDLAEKLQLSPTPIIQALKWLELQGFVQHEPNRGYSMAPFSLKEIEELYEIRELIEPSLYPLPFRISTRRVSANSRRRLRPSLSRKGILSQRKAFQKQGIPHDPCFSFRKRRHRSAYCRTSLICCFSNTAAITFP